MTRGMRLFAGAALLFGLTAARADDKSQSNKPFDDTEFVKMAASGGLHEVDLGKLASTKAANPEVKKFAERMVTDHGKANEELKKAAKAANIECPTKMNEHHQKEFDRFKEFKGSDFDKEYINHMVKDHEEDVALFTRASKEAQNASIKQFAT